VCVCVRARAHACACIYVRVRVLIYMCASLWVGVFVQVCCIVRACVNVLEFNPCIIVKLDRRRDMQIIEFRLRFAADHELTTISPPMACLNRKTEGDRSVFACFGNYKSPQI
jgi:hypothetical protein